MDITIIIYHVFSDSQFPGNGKHVLTGNSCGVRPCLKIANQDIISGTIIATKKSFVHRKIYFFMLKCMPDKDGASFLNSLPVEYLLVLTPYLDTRGAERYCQP